MHAASSLLMLANVAAASFYLRVPLTGAGTSVPVRTIYDDFAVTAGTSGGEQWLQLDLDKNGHLVTAAGAAAAGLGEMYFTKLDNNPPYWAAAFTGIRTPTANDQRGPWALKNGSLVLDGGKSWYWYYCSDYLWGSPTLNQQSECTEFDISIPAYTLPSH